MKKVILSEIQIKKLIDSIITEQTTSAEKGYRLCSLSFVVQNGVFYLKNPQTNELSEIPKLSEISGIIRGNRRNGFNIAFDMDSETGYAIDLGDYIATQCRPMSEVPRSAAYKNMVVFDDIKYKIPMWIFLLSTNQGGTSPINGDTLKSLPEKDGTVIQLGSTRTDNFVFSIVPALYAQPIPEKEQPSTIPPKTPPKTRPIVLDLTSPFKFDSVEFVANSDSQQKLEAFINDVKKYYTNKNIKPIEVLASASIDGNPNQKLKNGMIRKDYDLDLSRRRADYIADILTKATGIKFFGNGIGQTEQFAPGKKFPDAKIEDTAPNRKLIVKMPEIQIGNN